MEPEKKNIKYDRLTSRDEAPKDHQVRPESLETFQPSYASSTVKNENDAIPKLDLWWLWQAAHLSTTIPINKPAMNGRQI